jgi:hypothetical protein
MSLRAGDDKELADSEVQEAAVADESSLDVGRHPSDPRVVRVRDIPLDLVTERVTGEVAAQHPIPFLHGPERGIDE